MSANVAIVEDEDLLAKNYAAALERAGYRVAVYGDRASAQAAFDQHLPDLVIIDIELGDEKDGGHALCQRLRQASATLPIVFLTARDELLDELLGLKLGANDYLTKGIEMPKLAARVEAHLKWAAALLNTTEAARIVTRGKLKLDLDCRTAEWDGQVFDTTYSEFGIIESLAMHPGHIKSRQQLMDALGKTIAEESVNSYIKRIRKKLKELDPDANPIRSEHSQGYRWVIED